MSQALVELFRHHQWANVTLCAACRQLTPDQLVIAAPHTYGNIHATLYHILVNEDRYLALIDGEQPDSLPQEAPTIPDVAAIEERLRASGDRFLAVAADVDPETMLPTVWRGEAYTIPVMIPLTQAIHHGTDHRAQICASLEAAGVEPPVLDAWAYLFRGDTG